LLSITARSAPQRLTLSCLGRIVGFDNGLSAAAVKLRQIRTIQLRIASTDIVN